MHIFNITFFKLFSYICSRDSTDLVPGFNTNEDAVKFAKEMEKVGIDLLNITGGWHESKVPQITGELPRGGFSFLGAAIKEQVNIHVAMGNRINHPTSFLLYR